VTEQRSDERTADSLREAFRESVRSGLPRLPLCEDCGRNFFYPRPRCPNCHSARVRLDSESAMWHLRSYTWVMRPQAPEFESRIPILIVVASQGDVNVIAEGDGWTVADPPRIGQSIQLASGRDPRNNAVAVFEAAERQEP